MSDKKNNYQIVNCYKYNEQEHKNERGREFLLLRCIYNVTI